jgi:hypothetical protein
MMLMLSASSLMVRIPIIRLDDYSLCDDNI